MKNRRMLEHGSTPVPPLSVGRKRLAATTPRRRADSHERPSQRVVCDLPEVAQTVEVLASLLPEARRGDSIALKAISELATEALTFRNTAARARMDELQIPADVPIPCDDVLAVLWKRVELIEDGHWRWLGSTNSQGTATIALPRRSPLASPRKGGTGGGNWRTAGRVLYEGLRGPVEAPFVVRTCGGLWGEPGERKGRCVNPWHAKPSNWGGDSS